MTLIAGFFRNGYPILMGDILASGTDTSTMELVFPTVGKVSRSALSNGKYSPSSLCQKVILVSPSLAIGWAGTKFYAQCFIKDLIEANCHKNPSQQSLSNIFDYQDKYGDLRAICLYRDGTKLGIRGFNSLPVYCQDEKFTYFSAAGTGYSRLSDIVEKMDLTRIFGNHNPTELEMGINVAWYISAALLSQEIIDSSSLRQLFGVGYEVVHPLGSELSKFDDVTYFFWKTEEQGKGSWSIPAVPFLSIKYSYHDDILIMRNVRTYLETETKTCIINRDESRAIVPIHRDFNPEELLNYSMPTLNSKWMSNVFIWKNRHGKTGIYASHIHHNLRKPPIIWLDEFDTNRRVEINMEFVKNLVTKLTTVS